MSIASRSLVSPLSLRLLPGLSSPSVERMPVAEQMWNWREKWSSSYSDVLGAAQDPRRIIDTLFREAFPQLGWSPAPNKDGVWVPPLGSLPREIPQGLDDPFVPKHKATCTKILAHISDDRLDIANSLSFVSSEGYAATSPEYALGGLRKRPTQREGPVSLVEDLLQDYDTPADLPKPLGRWLASRNDRARFKATANESTNSINGLSTQPLIQRSSPRLPVSRTPDTEGYTYDDRLLQHHKDSHQPTVLLMSRNDGSGTTYNLNPHSTSTSNVYRLNWVNDEASQHHCPTLPTMVAWETNPCGRLLRFAIERNIELMANQFIIVFNAADNRSPVPCGFAQLDDIPTTLILHVVAKAVTKIPLPSLIGDKRHPISPAHAEGPLCEVQLKSK